MDNLLKIEDEYCIKIKEYCSNKDEDLEEYISEYIAILERIQNCAIMSGDVSEALNEYLGLVKQLQGEIGSLSMSVNTQITAFLSHIGKADQYLF